MGHTFTTNFVHVVFSTKERTTLIPADRLENLWAYLIGIAHNYNIETLATGGIRDHVHMLFALPKTMTLADAIGKLKANSSRWLSETGPRFAWQEGYAGGVHGNSKAALASGLFQCIAAYGCEFSHSS